jgi:orotidine-5'-phosphate decarboxylase
MDRMREAHRVEGDRQRDTYLQEANRLRDEMARIRDEHRTAMDRIRDDARRVGEAIRAGIDHMVIGRPITGVADPARAMQAILDEIQAVS